MKRLNDDEVQLIVRDYRQSLRTECRWMIGICLFGLVFLPGCAVWMYYVCQGWVPGHAPLGLGTMQAAYLLVKNWRRLRRWR